MSAAWPRCSTEFFTIFSWTGPVGDVILLITCWVVSMPPAAKVEKVLACSATVSDDCPRAMPTPPTSLLSPDSFAFTPNAWAILTTFRVPTRWARSAKAELEDSAAALGTEMGPKFSCGSGRLYQPTEFAGRVVLDNFIRSAAVLSGGIHNGAKPSRTLVFTFIPCDTAVAST